MFNAAFLRTVSWLWRKKWYGLALCIWEILRDRASEWANARIDEHAERVVAAIAKIIVEYLSYPLSWVLIAAILIFVVLFLHSYFVEQKRNPSQVQSSKDEDYWAERNCVEIYILANASANIASPTTSPTNEEPQLTRLRELKDAIKDGELDVDLNIEKPMWSTVTLRDFELYAAAGNKFHWNEVLQRWRKRQEAGKSTPQADWKIVEAMDYIAAKYGNENEEHLDTKYAEPTRLLTSKARSGEIQVWGRRIFDDDNAELSQRQMKQSDWEDIELSMWACTTSAGHSHTESASQQVNKSTSQQEVQHFTDLLVSESQIKSTKWS